MDHVEPCALPVLLNFRHVLVCVHVVGLGPAGNGLSDKPKLFSARGTQWTIDDYVEKDVPAIIRFVLKETKTQQVHFLGHSMVRALWLFRPGLHTDGWPSRSASLHCHATHRLACVQHWCTLHKTELQYRWGNWKPCCVHCIVVFSKRLTVMHVLSGRMCTLRWECVDYAAGRHDPVWSDGSRGHHNSQDMQLHLHGQRALPGRCARQWSV